MSLDRTAWELEQVARELDLVVFGLERPRPEGTDAEAERAALRRSLEELRDRVEQLARSLG